VAIFGIAKEEKGTLIAEKDGPTLGGKGGETGFPCSREYADISHKATKEIPSVGVSKKIDYVNLFILISGVTVAPRKKAETPRSPRKSKEKKSRKPTVHLLQSPGV